MMNRKKFMTIVLALAIAASGTALMTGCTASYYQDGRPLVLVSGAAAAEDTESAGGEETPAETGDETSVEETSEAAETSTAEESVEESVEESTEESAEESVEESTEESAEESSEESTEESSEEQGDGIVVKFQKPDEWGDTIKAYVYITESDKNEDWPGELMKDEGDGIYSYTVSKYFAESPDAKIIFNDSDSEDVDKKHQYPKNKGLKIKADTVYDINTKDE